MSFNRSIPISVLSVIFFVAGNAICGELSDRDTLFHTGRDYFFSGQHDQAKKYFKQILDLNPDDIDVNFYRGWCAEEDFDYKSAAAYYQQALKKQPRHIEAAFRLGLVSRQMADWGNAEKYFLKVKELDNSWTNIYPHLVDTYAAQNSPEKEYKVLSRLVSADPANVSWKQKLKITKQALGEEYFKKIEKEKRARQEKTITISPIEGKGIPQIRIGLAQDIPALGFKCGRGFQIIDTACGRMSNPAHTENTPFRVVAKNNKIIICDENDAPIQEHTAPILIAALEAASPITLFELKLGEGAFLAAAMDRDYRGRIRIELKNKKLQITNEVNLEEYLYGVVPAEMTATWPTEALNTQAIVARTAVYAQRGRHREDGFDFCSESHCQAYRGVREESPATNRAVDTTRGMIIVYQDKPIEAIYSNNCGGHTQDNIFGAKAAVPYLQGRLDTLNSAQLERLLAPLELEKWLLAGNEEILCNNSTSNFRWKRVYTDGELTDIINKYYKIGRVKNVILLNREKSLHLSRVRVEGATGTAEIEGELNIRKVFGGLRSSMFDLWIKLDRKGTPDTFIFYGGGWGHAVGLCQNGTRALAEKGYSADFVLQFYYKGTTLKKIY